MYDSILHASLIIKDTKHSLIIYHNILGLEIDSNRPDLGFPGAWLNDGVTVPPTMDIYFVAGIFLKNKFRRLPVVEDGKIVGAITRFDLLRVVQALSAMRR